MNKKLDPNTWVDSYADYLYRYAIIRVNSAQQAEDLVQDTFLSGIKGLHAFKGKSNERTWLTAILRRKIIDHYRKQSGNKEVSIDNLNDRFKAEGIMKNRWIKANAPQRWVSAVDQQVETDEFYSVLRSCIAHLPDAWASCFVLRTIEELSTDEVCKELNISSSNLWVMLHRARLKLRECLENTWFI